MLKKCELTVQTHDLYRINWNSVPMNANLWKVSIALSRVSKSRVLRDMPSARRSSWGSGDTSKSSRIPSPISEGNKQGERSTCEYNAATTAAASSDGVYKYQSTLDDVDVPPNNEAGILAKVSTLHEAERRRSRSVLAEEVCIWLNLGNLKVKDFLGGRWDYIIYIQFRMKRRRSEIMICIPHSV